MADADRESNIARGCLQTILIGVVIIIAIGAITGGPGSGGGGESTDDVTWEEYDVTIEVGENGVLHVTEHQEVRFDGEFSQGYAVIPMERIESIDNVRISVEGRPEDQDDNRILSEREARRDGEMMPSTQVYDSYGSLDINSFRIGEDGNNFRIDYRFESTGGGIYSFASEPQVRTVELEYDVTGAIRDYPEAEEPWQQVHWMAISSEVTDIADINASTVTIILPEDVPGEDLAWAPEPDNVDGNRLTWSKSSMTEGDSFDVQAAFPAITSATAPDWQPAADERDARIQDEENRQSLASVLLIGAGILTVVGGGIGLLYAWYSRVREAVPGVVPDQVSEPPDDLPAALVGALVDEEVHPRDIAAAIIDLDRRGIVKISPEDGSEIKTSRFGRRGNYNIELVEPITNAMPYEQTILRSIFRRSGTPGSVESFDALRALFSAYRDDIQRGMDEELVNRGYLVELPEKSRKRWTLILKGFVILTVVISVGILVYARSWTWWALLPPIVGLGMYYLGKRLTPSIAMKTPKGAEVSARWLAFENYLRSDKYGLFGDEWERIREEHLPWVIAFGMDRHWLRSMNTPYSAPRRQSTRSSSSPSWGSSRPRTHTWSSGRSSSRGSWGSSGSGWSTSSPSWGWDASQWPDMQDASDGVMSKISSGSSSMFDMLGDAMEAMGEHSRNSGGGSSFGGFGGSSSSGGGRSSSSSGGGSRGFS